ncbi:alpha/beta hydrolase family protein [Fodinicola feengrottensis]
MTRRSALRSFLSAALLAPTAGCTVASATRSPGVPTAVPLRYGPDPSQVLDLHLPAGTSRSLPVVVVIHGGYWSDAYGKDLGDPLAVDLANRGYAAVNIEYRRLGSGGGWPATLTDVAAAIDSLDTVVRPAAHDRLDLTRVVALGHSAGGQLAVWAAARPGFPSSAPGSGPKVRLRAAISQAGVVDLITGAHQQLGGGAVQALLGGSPEAVPERYTLASPSERIPVGVPISLVHGDIDSIVPIEQSERYAAKAQAAGDKVTFVKVSDADHFAMINPKTPAWQRCVEQLGRLI